MRAPQFFISSKSSKAIKHITNEREITTRISQQVVNNPSWNSNNKHHFQYPQNNGVWSVFNNNISTLRLPGSLKLLLILTAAFGLTSPLHPGETLQESWVIVYLWLPYDPGYSEPDAPHGGAPFFYGHLAIQGPHLYVRFRPGNSSHPGENSPFLSTFEQDKEILMRPPNYTFKFYSLNVPLLESLFLTLNQGDYDRINTFNTTQQQENIAASTLQYLFKKLLSMREEKSINSRTADINATQRWFALAFRYLYVCGLYKLAPYPDPHFREQLRVYLSDPHIIDQSTLNNQWEVILTNRDYSPQLIEEDLIRSLVTAKRTEWDLMMYPQVKQEELIAHLIANEFPNLDEATLALLAGGKEKPSRLYRISKGQ